VIIWGHRCSSNNDGKIPEYPKYPFSPEEIKTLTVLAVFPSLLYSPTIR
jgi:hypothetical protein